MSDLNAELQQLIHTWETADLFGLERAREDLLYFLSKHKDKLHVLSENEHVVTAREVQLTETYDKNAKVTIYNEAEPRLDGDVT